MNKHTITLQVNDDLLVLLKSVAQKEELSVSALIRKILKAHLKEA